MESMEISMEKRTVKRGITTLLIESIVFSFIGIMFILVGSLIPAENIEGDARAFRAIFCGLGAVLLIVGLVCLCLELSQRIRCNRLINAGQYIMAEISEITRNYAVCVNNRHPYIIICRYQDQYGNIHMFKSRNLYYDPAPLLRDQMVKVYVDREDFRHYYMDIDEVLPRVIRH